jgi:SAM-dependent methyltransferase
MRMAPAHPTQTHRLFQHDRVAAGYASARPYLHPEVFACVRELVGPGARFQRALDVGCGTGLSSIALLGLAEAVVGVDVATRMLRHARRAAGVRYVASGAEALPFRESAFDLVVACGSMDWIDRPRFLPRARGLIQSGGWLVSLDFGDTGRSPDMRGLGPWYDEVFLRAYPRPGASDPKIAAVEAARHGFAPPLHCDFATACSFTASQYTAFLMTESSVIAAVEYGGSAEADVRAWLDDELAPLFGRQPRRVAFAGYVQALRRL